WRISLISAGIFRRRTTSTTPTPPHRPDDPAAEVMTFRPDARFWLVYACLMTVQFLGALYHTVVATALPTVIGELGGVAHMSWRILRHCPTT
ncbi:MFS family major facilitator transporter, partial [human gut metagenome]